MTTYKYQLSLEIIHNIELCSQEMTDGNKCFYFSEETCPIVNKNTFLVLDPKSSLPPPSPQKSEHQRKMHLTTYLGDGKTPVISVSIHF